MLLPVGKGCVNETILQRHGEGESDAQEPGSTCEGNELFRRGFGDSLRLPAGAANDGEVLPLLAASRTWEPGLMKFLTTIVTLKHLGCFFICCLVCC